MTLLFISLRRTPRYFMQNNFPFLNIVCNFQMHLFVSTLYYQYNINFNIIIELFFSQTTTMILDDCDKALSLAGAAEFGTKYACANFSRKVLPPRCDIPTETCHR